MSTQPLRGFWFANDTGQLLLIEATGRLSANEAYEEQTKVDRVFLSCPAVACPVCGAYKPAIAGFIRDAIYTNYNPCRQETPGHKAPEQPG